MENRAIFLLIAVFTLIFLTGCSPKTSNEKFEAINTSTLENPSFTLISTGDIGLVRDVNNKIILTKDPTYPFQNIANYLKSANITITNLEGPLVENCPVILSGFKFCGSQANVQGLVYAGIDAVNLANNHTTNYGLTGLAQTVNTLKSAGIEPFGLENEIVYTKVNDYTIALVGFVELGNNWAGLNNATDKNVQYLVGQATENAEIVITVFHWGNEYTRKPTNNQEKLAHLAIDSGADLVLGNHAHWIQEEEIYKGVFITYAQGNTIFDQDWSQETKEGVIFKFEYKNGIFQKIEEKFTIIENNSQPRFTTEEETVLIKSKINR